eukprot:391733-Amphidinium_carterae.1
MHLQFMFGRVCIGITSVPICNVHSEWGCIALALRHRARNDSAIHVGYNSSCLQYVITIPNMVL